MLSPTMTVVVLAVLWLIVVVPMILRRHDERRRERSVAGFGRAMRALGRRGSVHSADEHAEVYVPRERRAAAERAVERAARVGARAASDAPTAARRPVPAAREALMYPPDRSDLSAARAHMMRRRRRSLGILGLGSLIFLPTALLTGGLMWLLAVPFAAGLSGYLWFLRSQALRDRERRSTRQRRAAERHTHGYDVTEDVARIDEAPSTVVRIDDDDIELHSMDTIDLTGLYSEELAAEIEAQRRAS